MELDTVIGSDLPARNAFSIADAGGFSQDEYIKKYLLDPDLSLISKIKIGLRYYITAQPELIVQLGIFKSYLKSANLNMFIDIFGKPKNKG